jgi:2-polyprenyl-6-hydroxyphenyl methylase/3-demethylubiquinone-9 3-methyltransferase
MMINADPNELEKFSQLAHRWWDPGSDFKPLHDINPLRLDWIDGHCQLAGKNVLDVGCGGGLLSEGMCERGATVTGIDLSDKALSVARLHLLESGRRSTIGRFRPKNWLPSEGSSYDVVTCMEMLEHVPDPASTVAACAALVKPGGHAFSSRPSTAIRKPTCLRLLAPSMCCRCCPRALTTMRDSSSRQNSSRWLRNVGLDPDELRGMSYNPFSGKHYALGRDTDVNYLLHSVKNV